MEYITIMEKEKEIVKTGYHSIMSWSRRTKQGKTNRDSPIEMIVSMEISTGPQLPFL